MADDRKPGAKASEAEALETKEGDFVACDFAFDSGERLPELKLHYTTLGTPVRDESGKMENAMLILHGTGGAGRAFLNLPFARLFAPGELLDARTHYIILPDGIGHGLSGKPSDGLKGRFPRYAYRDMVRAQHRLLTEGLGVNHLRLVMGTSMGGMHTWLWGETFPDFMDALMPLASLPAAIAGRNRMMRRMVIDSIRNDPEWKNGDYEKQPRGLVSAVYTILFMVSVPLKWQRQAPTRDEADALFDRMVADFLGRSDANDMLYCFDASRDYDPLQDLEKIAAPLTAVNTADDQVNPPELAVMEAAIPRVKRGRYVLLPIGGNTEGHRSHSFPELWKEHLAALLERSKRS
jgi:homoserine O-acetyltransferase